MDIENQYDKIYRYCFFKLKDRETAEDITQEVFLRCLERERMCKSELKLPYLYTAARNLCVDEYRKNKANSLNDIDDIYDAADVEMEAVTCISVKKAMEKLNEADRELLLLRYVNEVPVSDIAKIYNTSRFAVYRMLLQAKARFKENYE